MITLGISDNHDSGACLVRDGVICCAVNEERLSRVKLHGGFPYRAVEEVISESGIAAHEIDTIALASFMTPASILRALEGAHLSLRERSSSFSYLLNLYILYQVAAHALRVPELVERALSERIVRQKLRTHGIRAPRLAIVEHHQAHAASAYYTSDFGGEVLVITADAMGDAVSLTVNIGRGARIERIFSQTALSALSTHYARLTEFLGFRPVRHEGKVTGLAGYGEFDPQLAACARNQLHFDPESKGFNLTNHFSKTSLRSPAYAGLRGHRRQDVAHNFQHNFEEQMLRFVRFWLDQTRLSRLVLAGGAFANVSLNGRIAELPEIERLSIFPHMGDGGLAVGAALSVSAPEPFRLASPYLGPEYDVPLIENVVSTYGLCASLLGEDALCRKIAELIAGGKTVGHFNGRMEYGPRALGNRSILYRADDPSCQGWLNAKLARDYFMPFAPVTLAHEAADLYPGIEKISSTLRFMNVAVKCTGRMKERYPGVVHADGTARPQLLADRDNPRLEKVLESYQVLTGKATVINTSFNRHEEPIVCTPEDAVRSFLECDLDYLVLNNFLVWKKQAH